MYLSRNKMIHTQIIQTALSMCVRVRSYSRGEIRAVHTTAYAVLCTDVIVQYRAHTRRLAKVRHPYFHQTLCFSFFNRIILIIIFFIPLNIFFINVPICVSHSIALFINQFHLRWQVLRYLFTLVGFINDTKRMKAETKTPNQHKKR